MTMRMMYVIKHILLRHGYLIVGASEMFLGLEIEGGEVGFVDFAEAVGVASNK